MITQQEYQQRRKKLLSLLPKNSVVVVANGHEKRRNGDSNYLFSPNRHFYYLTGVEEPAALAVITPTQYILFTQKSDPEKARWLGKCLGQEKAKQIYLADNAYTLAQFKDRLTALLKPETTIYTASDDANLNAQLSSITNNVKDLTSFIGECRLIKSAAEIAIMQKAATISSQAHQHVMKKCKPGLYEYQLEAEFMYQCAMQGARFQAYPPIFASGANACTLHYEKNNQQLKANNLILIDAGCEYQHYASDITRTIPINGKFTEAQKAIYQIVLDTQLTIIDMVKPGIKFNVLQETTVKLLTNGLVKLGLLQGELDELISQKAYFQFYMHGVSHWLGLDTHDIGSYKIADTYRELQPGQVLTVEPGLYIAEDNKQVDAKWRGIGVRIEDDVLVTETGCHVLSDVPKTIAEIENSSIAT